MIAAIDALICSAVFTTSTLSPAIEPRFDPPLASATSELLQSAKSVKPGSEGDRLVKLALAADREVIHPGEKLTLATKLMIEPKWHVYWQNPGDAGAPTRIEVHAPAGFKVSEVRYPVPYRDVSADDVVSYVYSGEVALLFDVEAPKDLAPGSIASFAIDGRWLVCTSLCVPGSGHAAIEIRCAASSEPVQLANEKEFAAWRERMPRPYEDLLAIEGYHDSGFKDRKKPFAVTVPGALALDFYPRLEDPVSLEVMNLELQREANGCTMKLTFEPPADYEGHAFGFSGVLAVHTAKGEKYYELGARYKAAE
jgi:thiol:disulfide interchange protein DsbD